MPHLNEQLDWTALSTNEKTKKAFRGDPQKIRLDPGKMLCRFITGESLKRGITGNETFKSPWWLDWSTAIAEINQWKARKVPVKDVIRGRFAVTTQFNPGLDYLVQIILTQPVWCWKGAVNYQDDTVRHLSYLGGAEQLFLPNLASDDLGLSSEVAKMHSCTSVDLLK